MVQFVPVEQRAGYASVAVLEGMDVRQGIMQDHPFYERVDHVHPVHEIAQLSDVRFDPVRGDRPVEHLP